jgi:hypothetical protein
VPRFDLPEHGTRASLMWYYRNAHAGLRELRRRLPTTGAGVSPFAYMTQDELKEAFEQLLNELDRQTTLCLVSCYEGMLRVDALNRVGRKLKDPVSRAMRRRGMHWLARKASVTHLIDLWLAHAEGVEAHRIGTFKPLLQRRHWLAHGRYWDDSRLPPASPELAERMAEEFFACLPDFPAIAR